VPAVRSRREQLKRKRAVANGAETSSYKRRARLMTTNEVVASIRDRPRVVGRQVPGRAGNDRRACTRRSEVQEANASPEATV